MLTPDPHPTSKQFPALPEGCCLVLIGMAAAGKSTVGQALAEALAWVFADSDHLIESAYGTSLQKVSDGLSKEEFLDMEADFIQSLRLSRIVLATGGSVVYRPQAMAHLASLGPLIHLDVSLPIILERIARKPDRGLAIAPGQTVADLYAERAELYQHYAEFSLKADTLSPLACAKAIISHFQNLPLQEPSPGSKLSALGTAKSGSCDLNNQSDKS